MPEHIIRPIRLAAGSKRPGEPPSTDEPTLCLLALYPPHDDGLAQRRLIEVVREGESAWYGYEVVRAFADEAEARGYATAHGIEDVALQDGPAATQSLRR